MCRSRNVFENVQIFVSLQFCNSDEFFFFFMLSVWKDDICELLILSNHFSSFSLSPAYASRESTGRYWSKCKCSYNGELANLSPYGSTSSSRSKFLSLSFFFCFCFHDSNIVGIFSKLIWILFYYFILFFLFLISLMLLFSELIFYFDLTFLVDCWAHCFLLHFIACV